MISLPISNHLSNPLYGAETIHEPIDASSNGLAVDVDSVVACNSLTILRFILLRLQYFRQLGNKNIGILIALPTSMSSRGPLTTNLFDKTFEGLVIIIFIFCSLASPCVPKKKKSMSFSIFIGEQISGSTPTCIILTFFAPSFFTSEIEPSDIITNESNSDKSAPVKYWKEKPL